MEATFLSFIVPQNEPRADCVECLLEHNPWTITHSSGSYFLEVENKRVQLHGYGASGVGI